MIIEYPISHQKSLLALLASCSIAGLGRSWHLFAKAAGEGRRGSPGPTDAHHVINCDYHILSRVFTIDERTYAYNDVQCQSEVPAVARPCYAPFPIDLSQYQKARASEELESFWIKCIQCIQCIEVAWDILGSCLCEVWVCIVGWSWGAPINLLAFLGSVRFEQSHCRLPLTLGLPLASATKIVMPWRQTLVFAEVPTALHGITRVAGLLWNSFPVRITVYKYPVDPCRPFELSKLGVTFKYSQNLPPNVIRYCPYLYIHQKKQLKDVDTVFTRIEHGWIPAGGCLEVAKNYKLYGLSTYRYT